MPDSTNMARTYGQIPVRPDDRRVLDEIRKPQRRKLADQFASMLDEYCEKHGLNRRTGKPKRQPAELAKAS